jgi:hypothetical protein
LGGADPASPFLLFLDGDRIRYGIISAGPYRATGRGELHRRMLPVLHLDPMPSKRTGSAIPASASKIVAAGFGELKKRRGHDGADRVATDVLSPSVAAAVSKEPRHWGY